MKIIIIMGLFSYLFNKDITHEYLDNQIDISISHFTKEYEEYHYNGESIDEISNKINKYLNGKLDGKGKFITEYSLSVGIDPYLVSGVILQETGCYWNCSYLVNKCNNVAGNKGTPSCNGGSYRKFDTIEDGIKFAINKLNSYYKKGLTEASEINPYYAQDDTWYIKVNNYIDKIKKG